MQTKRRKLRRQEAAIAKRIADRLESKKEFNYSGNDKVYKAINLPSLKTNNKLVYEFKNNFKTGDLSALGKQVIELGERTLEVVRWR